MCATLVTLLVPLSNYTRNDYFRLERIYTCPSLYSKLYVSGSSARLESDNDTALSFFLLLQADQLTEEQIAGEVIAVLMPSLDEHGFFAYFCSS